jgi:MGT family glycosyltransferase
MKRRYGTFPVGLLSAGMCTGTLNVVFTSRALQPGGSRIGDDYVFVGPTAENRRDPMELPPQDLEHSPLVYISLGTLARNPAFFLTCFDAFSREPGRFVLSIGKQTDISGLGDIPDNFLVRRSVPQLQILKHADAFITHGGLNSVQESLIQGVPMIAIPQQLEQAAVALQMARHGAGIALRTSPPYAVVSAQELRLALRSILSNPAYAAAARRLGSSLAESGGSASPVRHVLEFSRRAVTESAAHPG